MISEERLELLAELHAPPVHPDYLSCDSWVEFARAIEREAYKQGQEAMRERAIKLVKLIGHDWSEAGDTQKFYATDYLAKWMGEIQIEEPK